MPQSSYTIFVYVRKTTIYFIHFADKAENAGKTLRKMAFKKKIMTPKVFS